MRYKTIFAPYNKESLQLSFVNAGLIHTTLGLFVVVVRAVSFFNFTLNFKLFFQLLNWLFFFFSFLGQAALTDAGIPYSAVKQACVGYVYGEYCLTGM